MAREESVVLVDGAWRHRAVSANGARFHVVESGEGPLVLLLHGFPMFWWTWRHQLVALAGAGYHVVAPDLRGYGASDKPPRGYDLLTLTADVAGLVRALGERSAVLVGQDWGGLLAWTVATLHPQLVRRLVVLGVPHPLQLRHVLLSRDTRQLAASRHLFGFQLPWIPERWLTTGEAANVPRLLAGWSARRGWLDAEASGRYRDAMLIPGVAHCSLEYFRWAVRSLFRPDGVRAARLLARGVSMPTLQVHGTDDPAVLAATAAASQQFARGAFEWVALDGVGHLPQEESPEEVTELLLGWVGERTRARDRDRGGRPRNARARDHTGRPLPRGATGEPTLPDPPVLSAQDALDEADRLLATGRPFRAHEVLEAVWKAAPEPERPLWRGLAQLAVGLTHLQRGNLPGAVALLRRGAATIRPYADPAPHGVAVSDLVTAAERLAEQVQRDGVAPDNAMRALRIRPAGGYSPAGNG